MFEDLTLSETELKTEGSIISQDETGNANEDKTSEAALHAHEATIPLNSTSLHKH